MSSCYEVLEILHSLEIACSGPLPAPDPSTATHATPALSGTQPPGLGVFESACPSAPGSSHQPPASSAEPTRRAPVARHPTEELDAKPPVHAPEQVTIVSPIRWRERKVGTKTFYWEPERLALQIIRTPPDLTGEPKLALGDLFYYQTLTRFQFWIWILDDAGRPHWKAIRYGYQRDDGRRLMITPVERKPAWVTPERWCQYRHGKCAFSSRRRQLISTMQS